jgi:hypothetical protein
MTKQRFHFANVKAKLIAFASKIVSECDNKGKCRWTVVRSLSASRRRGRQQVYDLRLRFFDHGKATDAMRRMSDAMSVYKLPPTIAIAGVAVFPNVTPLQEQTSNATI